MRVFSSKQTPLNPVHQRRRARVLLSTALTLCLLAASVRAATPPNIILILADDIGYGDLGCYGATKVRTPNVDRLAQEGIRCTDAHATASVCTPSRYAMLTGQYAFRNPAAARILPADAPMTIAATTPTTASILKQAGYTTGLVGKWHLGLGHGDLDWNKDIKPGPLEAGFDYAFFIPATGDRVPCVFVENRRVAGLDPNDPIVVNYQLRTGRDPIGKEHPEMLTLKPSQGHADTIVNGISRIGFMSGGTKARWKDERIADTLTAKAVAFIEQNKDKPFFLHFATHDIHVPRVPDPRHQGTSKCGVRGDVIQEFDDSVGLVLATLDRLGLAYNTLVLVTSDNGGVLDDGYADGAVAASAGHACNGNLRGFKGSLYEGGSREPLLVRWPARIKPDVQCDQLIGLVDLLATFAAAAGVELPATAGPDSFNVLPLLLGQKEPIRDHLVVQGYGPNLLAIRKGSLKLIPGNNPRPSAGPARPEAPQLYNLTSDLGERLNLAGQQPDSVRDLSALLQKVRQNPRSRP